MTNHSQDRAFKPEFYILLEQEREKEKKYRDSALKISQAQQELLDKFDGVEPEVEEEKEKKSMSKKKNKNKVAAVATELKPNKIVEAPETVIIPTKAKGLVKVDGWEFHVAHQETICSKCNKVISKGSEYYWKSKDKKVHINCK